MEKKLRVVVLTTESKHHTYFLNRLAPQFDLVAVFYERRRLRKPYATGPFFAAEEDAFEEKFFDGAAGGTDRTLPADIEKRVVSVHSVNQTGVAAHVSALNADIGVTFGVGRVERAVFSAPRWGTINVHRGISQLYRGLDSDLWAVYEGRFDQIGVTVHYVADELDTGAMVAQEYVPLESGDEIFHLRYRTSVVATRMVADVLSQAAHNGRAPTGRPQPSAGRYYSAMALEQKHQALAAFRLHQEKGSRDAG